MPADSRHSRLGVHIGWRRRAIRICAAILLLNGAFAGALSGQTPAKRYTHAGWTRKDGLRGSQVWSLAQDRIGYIWLGTNEGLVRFDSVRFVKSADLGLRALPARSVRTLLIARDGTMWMGFGADGGISSVKDGRVRNYGVADGLPLGAVAALLQGEDGVIWAATVEGLFRLSLDRWESMQEQNGSTLKTVEGLFEDSQGMLWVGTTRGVYRLARHDQRLSLYSSRPNIRSFSVDRFGTIWATGLGTTVTAIAPRRVDDRQVEFVPGVNGSRLVHDRDGTLWVGTLGDGLLHFDDFGARMIEQYKGDPRLTSDVIQCVLQDREGNIWAGTQNGLNRFSEASVVAVPDPNDGMSRLVRAVTAAADGSIWVAAGDGLYQFSGATRRRFDWRSGLPRGATAALHSDLNGHLWVATSTSVGEFSNGRFHPLASSANVLFSRIRSIAVDARGDLWTCDLDRGVLRLRNGRRVPIKDDPGPKGCSTLYADRSGRVWVGLLDGTMKLYEGEEARSFSESDGLLGGMIVSIHEDSNHQIWIASPRGLSVFRGGRFAGIGSSSGLPGNIVVAVSSDRFGSLWLGVSSGIVKVDQSEVERALASASYRMKFRLFESADGVRGDPIGLGDPSVARAPDGTLWFTTSDGLALVDPQRGTSAPVPPLVNIEQVVADDRLIPPQSRVALDPRTRRVQVDFTALSFTAPEKTQFQYRLEGYDHDWVDGGAAHQAIYTNLQPGRYKFVVRAVNQNAISALPAEWPFSIRASFVQTPWFPASLVGVIVIVIAGGWRLHVHQVNAKFSAVLVERARVARELHDTLLQSLSSIALQLDDIATFVASAPRVAEPRLHDLRKRVEFWVREARQSITDLRSSSLETRDLGTALKEAGHRLTADRPIDFAFALNGTPRQADGRTEENLFRIGQEAIRNSIRHGNARRIALELTYHADALSLRVSDDGHGFDPAAITGANHWGLTTMEERAEQIGGVFRLTSRAGIGTVVEIFVDLASRQHQRQVRRAS